MRHGDDLTDHAAHAQQAALVEAERALHKARTDEEAERLRAEVDRLAVPDATP